MRCLCSHEPGFSSCGSARRSTMVVVSTRVSRDQWEFKKKIQWSWQMSARLLEIRFRNDHKIFVLASKRSNKIKWVRTVTASFHWERVRT